MIVSSLFYFFFAIVFYQVFSTVTVYGLELFSAQWPAYIRELFWILAIGIILILNRKQIGEYLKRRKWCRIVFIILSIFSVGISFLLCEKTLSDCVVGFKYCFQRMAIFLSFTMIGFFYKEKLKSQTFLSWLKIFIVFVVLFWFFWQIGKLIRPNLFELMGYTLNLDNYQYGMKPPIYYLTGYEGTLRWQGLFSGPNNYGYFLVGFFPLVVLLFWMKWKELKNLTVHKIINLSVLGIWILAMIVTLSRAVFVWGLLILLGLNWSFLKKQKKKMIMVIIMGVLALLWISIWKWDSTKEHLVNKFSAVSQFFDQPLGYGLWTSGPAVHYHGVYLPENYYFQILLDTGTIGFLIQMLFFFQLLRLIRLIFQKYQSIKITEEESIDFLMLRRLQLGFLALLIIGFFLHVFEDSMVNYLFFGMYGIFLGKCSTILGEVKWYNPFSLKALKTLRKK